MSPMLRSCWRELLFLQIWSQFALGSAFGWTRVALLPGSRLLARTVKGWCLTIYSYIVNAAPLLKDAPPIYQELRYILSIYCNKNK